MKLITIYKKFKHSFEWNFVPRSLYLLLLLSVFCTEEMPGMSLFLIGAYLWVWGPSLTKQIPYLVSNKQQFSQ